MIEFEDYRGGDAAELALVVELTEQLADMQAAPIHRDDDAGYVVMPDGRVIDWTERRGRPVRRRGSVALDTPEALADYVARYRVAETMGYASRSSGTITVVINDHPQSGPDDTATGAVAGWRDNRAHLRLTESDEWAEWIRYDGTLRSQQAFGELIDSLAHTIITPDAATMLEIAQSLTAKRSVDFSSRSRLDNGDMSFRFEEDTTLRAGRGQNTIEIPTQFVILVRVWEGTNPVEVTARLRIRPGREGVEMGYKLIRVADARGVAFDLVCENVIDLVGQRDGAVLPLLAGSP